MVHKLWTKRYVKIALLFGIAVLLVGKRQWIGLWTGIICILIVAFDGSFAVKYITRYTEESFATLISSIFIVDGFKKVFGIEDLCPVNHNWKAQHILG